MDLATLHQVDRIFVCFAVLVVQGWLVFFPPKVVRSGLSIFRPVLAVLCLQGLYYAAYYGYLNPAVDKLVDAMEAVEGATLWDARLHTPPESLWLPTAKIALVYYLCLLLFRGATYLCAKRRARLLGVS